MSHVTGRLGADLTAYDALRAAFPAGTLSGAPKVRAMEIIAELEGERRGVYGGAVGYFSHSGNLDMAIGLRTLVLKDGVAYGQAGAGIVADSIPAKEYEEKAHKAGALMRALERAEAALRVFEIEAKGAEVSHGSRAVTGSFAEIVTTVGATSRLYDLTVVSQGEPDRETFDNQLPQDLLLQSGGPLLFMPYTFRGAFKAARIGICWDGSRLAARALRDSMPLLAEADVLTTITLNESDVPADASPAQLAKHLARNGLPVRTVTLRSDRGNVQSSLLSVAADEGFDLLVMGGYGHSRLQETVFGGVTREMFRSMTVPVLMSH